MQAKAASACTLDLAIGARLRARRRALGLSQSELARKLGVSFQQVQKYESGANRLAASTLVAAAQALEINPACLLGADPPLSKDEAELLRALSRPGALEVLQAFNAIADPHMRSAVLALLREIGDGPG
jgi:transcriptional regulator with XRE-family HTH domain